MLIGPLACNATPTVAATTMSQAAFVGRFDFRDPNAPRCAWPGSHIRARFGGTFIRATLTDTPTQPGSGETDWIDVIVDGAAPRTFQLSEGRHVYPLATGLSPGEHEITLWKRTESAVGVITFHGFDVGAGQPIAPTAAPARHLEVVGDSISAGYGNEGPDASCPWSARRENSYRTYGAIAARMLNASYTAIAWSGKGVTRNFDRREPLTLPDLYARVIPTEDDSPLVDNTPRPHAPRPDAYVVNLGTNDMFAGVPDGALFQREYLKLLKTLRARAPQALIVIALGPMLVDNPPRSMQRTLMRTWLTQVEQTWRTTIDTRITSIEFWTDPNEGLGCNSHPNRKTHQRLGNELATLLRQRLNW